MYKKMIEGIVAAAVPVLKGLKLTENGALKSYRHGVYDMLTSLLMRPGVSEKAMYEKVKNAFDQVHMDFAHTMLAEQRIAEALFA